MELLHNESLKELLDSESFWVAVAFFIFITLSFKKGKRIILKALDKRIENNTTLILNSNGIYIRYTKRTMHKI